MTSPDPPVHRHLTTREVVRMLPNPGALEAFLDEASTVLSFEWTLKGSVWYHAPVSPPHRPGVYLVVNLPKEEALFSIGFCKFSIVRKQPNWSLIHPDLHAAANCSSFPSTDPLRLLWSGLSQEPKWTHPR